ncbi:MAG TPA: putative lipid II flippase FtsW [Herpetosiphonaceae bacterium]
MQHARKPDQILLAIIGGLVAFGLVMVYSSSFVVAYSDYGSSTYWVARQAMFAFLGGIVMLAVMRFDYRKLRAYSVPMMLGTLALLLLVLLLPDSITHVNGASRWIKLGSFSLQPSELAKVASIVYFADWLSRRGSKVKMLVTGLLPFSIMLGLLAGLVLIQPDMGTTITIILIGATILFTSGASLLHLGLATFVAGGVGLMAVQSAGYRLQRVLVWQDPWQFAREGGYQPIHSLYALGTGGITGVGLGHSRQKFHWLPFAHTDAIFAVIGEELGLISTVLLIVVFLILGVRGLRIAARTSDPFGSLLAIGVTSWLVFQALLNMAVVSTLVPFTGITLPFISYGGTSLVTTMMAAGLLLSVSRYAPLKSAEDPVNDAPIPSIKSLQPHVAAAADVVRRWHGRARLPRAGGGGEPADGNLPPSLAVGSSFSGSWRRTTERRKRAGRFAFLSRGGGQRDTARQRVQNRRAGLEPDHTKPGRRR